MDMHNFPWWYTTSYYLCTPMKESNDPADKWSYKGWNISMNEVVPLSWIVFPLSVSSKRRQSNDLSSRSKKTPICSSIQYRIIQNRWPMQLAGISVNRISSCWLASSSGNQRCRHSSARQILRFTWMLKWRVRVIRKQAHCPWITGCLYVIFSNNVPFILVNSWVPCHYEFRINTFLLDFLTQDSFALSIHLEMAMPLHTNPTIKWMIQQFLCATGGIAQWLE